MLDADEAKLTKTGMVTITETEIYVEGFEGQGTSCRDLAALAVVWAIGALQRDLQATLEAPGGGISGIGGDVPEVELLRQDAARLDWLEAQAKMAGGLLLHDGTEGGRRGVGLLWRDLRKAIDSARGAARPAEASDA